MLKLVYGPGDTLDIFGVDFEWPDGPGKEEEFTCKDCGKKLRWGDKLTVHYFLEELKDREDFDWRKVSERPPLVSCQDCSNALRVFTAKENTIKVPMSSIYFWKSVYTAFCDIVYDGSIEKFDVDLTQLSAESLGQFEKLIDFEISALAEALENGEGDPDSRKNLERCRESFLKFKEGVLEPAKARVGS
jgi:hypothetical protein